MEKETTSQLELEIYGKEYDLAEFGDAYDFITQEIFSRWDKFSDLEYEFQEDGSGKYLSVKKENITFVFETSIPDQTMIIAMLSESHNGQNYLGFLEYSPDGFYFNSDLVFADYTDLENMSDCVRCLGETMKKNGLKSSYAPVDEQYFTQALKGLVTPIFQHR